MLNDEQVIQVLVEGFFSNPISPTIPVENVRLVAIGVLPSVRELMKPHVDVGTVPPPSPVKPQWDDPLLQRLLRDLKAKPLVGITEAAARCVLKRFLPMIADMVTSGELGSLSINNIRNAAQILLASCLDLLQADPHQWSERPCSTCSAISTILSWPFGCLRFAEEHASKESKI